MYKLIPLPMLEQFQMKILLLLLLLLSYPRIKKWRSACRSRWGQEWVRWCMHQYLGMRAESFPSKSQVEKYASFTWIIPWTKPFWDRMSQVVMERNRIGMIIDLRWLRHFSFERWNLFHAFSDRSEGNLSFVALHPCLTSSHSWNFNGSKDWGK